MKKLVLFCLLQAFMIIKIYSQGPPPPPDEGDPDAPFGPGIGLVIAAGLAYGAGRCLKKEGPPGTKPPLNAGPHPAPGSRD